MIKAISLTKTFDQKTALDRVDLTIEDGEIVGLIGSNGSGKSTLLRLIAGVYAPDGGCVELDGEIIYNNPEAKKQIAFLGDTPYFLPQSNLREMATFYRQMYPTFDYDVYHRLLKQFPLDEKAKFTTMSKGMQRQAALILMVSTSPRYLLLDEAFDGLDVVMRKVLQSILIEGAAKRKMTTVIASHNIRELEDLCDHVTLVHGGNLLFSDATERLRGKLHKVQIALSAAPNEHTFDGLDVLKSEQSGMLWQLVVRGEAADITAVCEALAPLFFELVEPTLEETFMYELEVNGYDAKLLVE